VVTTLKTAPAAIGAEAARLLIDQVDGIDATDVQVAPAEMLLRESTGPAPSTRHFASGPRSARKSSR
jgi:DNA-binding LacI/PurR family transcriptional regulator